jgi:DNA-binding NarL/FixJ family response regulator
LSRILIVDDNPAVRRYLCAALEQQSKENVCEQARTGGEALQRIKVDSFDIVLLDLQMPDLNGLDVARVISKLFPALPILMVTIHRSQQLVDEARKAGIRGVCEKSDAGAVVSAVSTILQEQATSNR